MFILKRFSVKVALLIAIGAFYASLFGLTPLARSSMDPVDHIHYMGPPSWVLNLTRPPTPEELFITIALGIAVLTLTFVFMLWSVDGLGQRM